MPAECNAIVCEMGLAITVLTIKNDHRMPAVSAAPKRVALALAVTPSARPPPLLPPA